LNILGNKSDKKYVRLFSKDLAPVTSIIFLLLFITQSGKGNWFYGVLLVGLFIAVAVGFYFVK